MEYFIFIYVIITGIATLSILPPYNLIEFLIACLFGWIIIPIRIIIKLAS